ncbi:MAG: (d)CMP kinase [Bacteroidales bacterium]
MKNKITIAIDGFSSCGKSTMAKELAKNLGYIYVDSGAMYRTITLYSLRNGIISNSGEIDLNRLENEMSNIEISFRFNSQTQRPDTYLNGELVENDIRLMEVSNNVSHIAAIGFVRKALVEMQQAMGKEKGIVMDGRDIGTVVFPDAELKIFVKASAQVRAQRRYDELNAKGERVNFDEILHNVVERDNIDMNRTESPLRQAQDALVLDNSNISIEEQNEWLIQQVQRLTNA